MKFFRWLWSKLVPKRLRPRERPNLFDDTLVVYGHKQEETWLRGHFVGISDDGRVGWVDSVEEHFCFDPKVSGLVQHRHNAGGEYVTHRIGP